MAYCAELNENNIVLRVCVIDDNIQDIETWCSEFFGGTWKATDTDGTIRKNYAGKGYTYDSQRDAFIPPRPPEGEWVLDEETCWWIPVEP